MDAPEHAQESAETASPRASDIRPKSTVRTPLPTDSIVSVRLSDTTAQHVFDTSPRHDAFELLSAAAEAAAQESISAFQPNAATTTEAHVPTPEETETDMVARRRESAISMSSLTEEEVTICTSIRSRSDSSGSLSSSNGSAHVDWDELEKSEEQAPRDEGSDESTAFLLARLEQENNALATDPKGALARARSTRKGTKARPPSIQHLKKLVNEPTRPSLRYSFVPEPPPMTELEFWAALVNDYPQTAQRLPTLTSNKIRSGVPPPLRGVVWMSIAGSRDPLLEGEYDRLCGETSPYENLIGKDIGRSFPGVEMFRDPLGEGQQMLGRVLKSFSLYDHKIGYCQGLGFVVGPLLMHMGDKEAFCVLVRLMEHYDLRSCFLPDLSGLHLRIYQFKHLLSKHLPTLNTHLENIQVEPLYVSQWFLSFFAVTCPLPMLLRIYDVILTEGASETLMRVALSLMRRNENKIIACTELEDVMGILLSRALWDTYGQNADDLVNDFVGLTGLVTREGLEALEGSFKDGNNEDRVAKESAAPSVQAAASRFLGRFWVGSNSASSVKLTSPTSSLNVVAPSRPTSLLRRTPSKQSMASTLNSIESTETHLTAASTEATSRNQSVDCTPVKPVNALNIRTSSTGITDSHKDLHIQIEDLLIALSDMQRDHSVLATELQKEREEREEDRAAIQRFLEQSRKPTSLQAIHEGEPHSSTSETSASVPDNQEFLIGLDIHFTKQSHKRSSIILTKHQMRDEIKLWKEQHEIETVRGADLSRQLTDERLENGRLLEQFRETRTRMQDAHQDKQRLEKIVSDMKSRRFSTDSDYESIPATPGDATGASGGLRQLKLGRSGSLRSQAAPATQSQPFAKRTSSLGISTVLATEDHKLPSEDTLLLELVNAKTSEAVARQELEEVKNKLDSLRKMLGGGPSPNGGSAHRSSPSEPCIATAPSVSNSTRHVKTPSVNNSTRSGVEAPKVVPPAASAGGFFSGWGKRMPSNPVVTLAIPEAS